jgi:hypothetical protein
MAHRRSPLAKSRPQSLSVCGKILKSGQTMLVPSSAIGSRERKMEAKSKIVIRSSNKKGMVQVVCTV